jgi:hypothetical protein
MEVEMFQPINNDEEITEEMPAGNKKRKYLRERIQINLVFTILMILPLVTFLLSIWFSEN